LEEAEEGQGVGGDVSGGVRVSQTGSYGRSHKPDTSDDSGSPADSLLIHGLAVRELSFDAGQTFTGIRGVDVDLNLDVRIRNTICNA